MATDYTQYEGRRLRGKPVTVLVRGTVVVHDGELVDPTPRGRHVEAAPLDFGTTPALVDAG
jgi:dihydropyrimidinase